MSPVSFPGPGGMSRIIARPRLFQHFIKQDNSIVAAAAVRFDLD